MRNTLRMLVLFFCLFIPVVTPAQDRYYTIDGGYEADAQGTIVQQVQVSGTFVVKADGSYSLQANVADSGRWQFVPRGTRNNPNDMYYMQSSQGFEYFAYIDGTRLAIWVSSSPNGNNWWLNAVATTPDPGGQEQGLIPGTKSPVGENAFSIVNGLFDRTVMFGNTSANVYLNYYEETGEFDADTKGVIFRADGTYYLKIEVGSSVLEERGRYQIEGDQIYLQFSDGSGITWKIEEGGRKLVYYSNGMLISEYFFLGTPQR